MQEKLEKTLEKLIAIPSVSGHTAACRQSIDYTAAELELLGLFTDTHLDAPHPWVYAATSQTKTPDILLVAHLDVVPAAKSLFTMTKHGDKLIGRGVYDMKFAAACYLELFKAHRETLQHKSIGVLFTTDEEIGGHSMETILVSGIRPKLAFIPDGGDNWSIEKRAKGMYTIELIAKGTTAHSSRPWEGENALHTLLIVIQTLCSKYPSDQPAHATLAVTRLEGGEVMNQVPHSASATLDFRGFDKQEIDDFTLLVHELARIHAITINPLSVGNPLLFDESSPLVQQFLDSFEALLGRPATYCESYGASDARFFAKYGIPSIIVQPRGGGRHSHNEWLSAKDLERYYRLLEQWLVSPHAADTKSPISLAAETNE